MSPIAPNTNLAVEQLLAAAAEQERNGNPWQAVNAYRQALQMDPRNHRGLLGFARMRHRARDFDGAIALYHQTLQFYPNDPVTLNDLGLCFARKGDIQQAIAILQRAVEAKPESKRYRNNLAVVQVDANQIDAAVQTLMPANGPAIANYNVAWLLVRQGQSQRAVPYLDAAILADPSLRPALDLMAHVQSANPAVASRTPSATTMPVAADMSESVYQSRNATPTEPTIQLRSGTTSDLDRHPVMTGVYEAPVGELPPEVGAIRIPGFDEP